MTEFPFPVPRNDNEVASNSCLFFGVGAIES
jgi:hypothetical protein